MSNVKILPAGRGSKTSHDLELVDVVPIEEIDNTTGNTEQQSKSSMPQTKGNFGWGAGTKANPATEENGETHNGTTPRRVRSRSRSESEVSDVVSEEEDENYNIYVTDSKSANRNKLNTSEDLTTLEFASTMLDAARMGNVHQSKRMRKKSKKSRTQGRNVPRHVQTQTWDDHMADLKQQIAQLRDEVASSELWGQAMDARRQAQRDADAAFSASNSVHGGKKKNIDGGGETNQLTGVSTKVVMKPFTGIGKQSHGAGSLRTRRLKRAQTMKENVLKKKLEKMSARKNKLKNHVFSIQKDNRRLSVVDVINKATADKTGGTDTVTGGTDTATGRKGERKHGSTSVIEIDQDLLQYAAHHQDKCRHLHHCIRLTKKWRIYPHSWIHTIWISCTMFFVLWTSIVLPVTIAFVHADQRPSWWVVVDTCADYFFIIDVLLNFRAVYLGKQSLFLDFIFPVLVFCFF
jgi:hypothetical protein